ncbi:aminotransferase class IV [uncultured Ilyobacter sp.]|uniref:aminotransferase class IV n=1 Tax=uncultured Ilyobacter sp. TaxID=544433 RepID=UPI0029C7A966|nr:aminotransferase class IV [uncultured Ilyobacter sp.]
MNYWNGKYTETPFSEGELYGTGLFETICIVNKKAKYLLEHYERLYCGGKSLDISFEMSYENFEKIIYDYITRSELNDFALRFTILKRGAGYDILINSRKTTYTRELYERGFSLKTSPLRKNPTSPLTYTKSTCYADNLISLKNAKSLGFDEALHLNFEDEVCEGAISNIFFIKDGIIKTPAVECGLLPGIMRKKVIQKLKEKNIPFQEGHYSLSEFIEADEVFITNSLMHVMWVNAIDDKNYFKRKNTDIIASFFIENKGRD